MIFASKIPSRRTLSGRSWDVRVRLKSSFGSNMLSSIIGTSNRTLVSPAGTMTVYGPET